MSAFKELLTHVGHDLACVYYGGDATRDAVNVAVECQTCHEVLLDFDKEGTANE